MRRSGRGPLSFGGLVVSFTNRLTHWWTQMNALRLQKSKGTTYLWQVLIILSLLGNFYFGNTRGFDSIVESMCGEQYDMCSLIYISSLWIFDIYSNLFKYLSSLSSPSYLTIFVAKVFSFISPWWYFCFGNRSYRRNPELSFSPRCRTNIRTKSVILMISWTNFSNCNYVLIEVIFDPDRQINRTCGSNIMTTLIKKFN